MKPPQTSLVGFQKGRTGRSDDPQWATVVPSCLCRSAFPGRPHVGTWAANPGHAASGKHHLTTCHGKTLTLFVTVCQHFFSIQSSSRCRLEASVRTVRNRVGSRNPRPLPHHRTCGSAHDGSCLPRRSSVQVPGFGDLGTSPQHVASYPLPACQASVLPRASPRRSVTRIALASG